MEILSVDIGMWYNNYVFFQHGASPSETAPSLAAADTSGGDFKSRKDTKAFPRKDLSAEDVQTISRREREMLMFIV